MSAGPALRGLLQRLSAPGAVAALARMVDGRLHSIEAPHAGAANLDFGALLADGEPVWTAAAGRRLPSAWVLLLGERPQLLATVRIAGTPWVLLAALAPNAAFGGSLCAAVRALAALWLEGAHARAEREQQQLATALVAALQTPVVFLGADAPAATFNPAAADLLGLAPHHGEAAGTIHALRELLRASGLPEVQRQALAHAGIDGASAEIEVEGRSLLVFSRRLLAPARGRLWQFQDVSALRQRERALYEGIRADTLARLAGGVAHQFNNLLTVLLGGAESIEADPSLPLAVRQSASGMLAAADRGAELVGQLLSYAARGPQPPVAIALDAELRGLLPLLRRSLDPRVRIEYAAGPGLDPDLVLLCERGQLADAVVNIALNAGQAMPAGGLLRIALEPMADAADGEVQVDPAGRLQWLRVSFSDTGVGMDADVLRHAREPFFTTRGMANARGLGLAVVDGFVRRCGGRMGLRSSPGGGCTVELCLPTQRTAPAPSSG